ncbi:hypothetical protein [Natrinema sp. SYSU A 869]|uniref:hypothetical protein n=1 Tax=Natrinema sp. SYSU A 869 TaxID=2871694 RepID=UPI001CA4345C|nr:hypothetical protein [Natrinema sp. SYSU A 869]
MTNQETRTVEDIDSLSEQHRPVYEFDPNAGPLSVGEVVCNVPREHQEAALRAIAGDGTVEPDGWFEGYNSMSLPVLDGIPITLLESSKDIGGRQEGAESWSRYAVKNVGHVELHRAERHPTNVSKIKVITASHEG